MDNSFLTYLMEASISLLLFIAIYRFLIARLTLFSWMRYFLLASVILSIALPMIHLPVRWDSSIYPYRHIRESLLFLQDGHGFATGSNDPAADAQHLAPGPRILVVVLLSVYWSGVALKAFLFLQSIKAVRGVIKKSIPVSDGVCNVINITDDQPAYSFLNYLFLNRTFRNLTTDELQQVRDHEMVHIRQRHTLDILFIEFTSIFLWFHPLMKYIKRSLEELHEYIADEETAGSGIKRREYARLLLNLTSETREFKYSAGFAARQIKQRITMLTAPRSHPLRKLLFSAVVPLSAMILLSFSYISKTEAGVEREGQSATAGSQEVLGKVTWTGNNVYSTGKLEEAFGLKTGDRYDSSEVFRRIKLSGVSDLYLDNGYVFFKADYTEKRHDGAVDLLISIYEGKIARFGDVIFRSDKNLPEEIRVVNNIHPGDLFSKAEIIRLIRALGDTGKFDREKINPKPIVNDEKGTDEYAVIDLLIELKGI